MTETEIQSKTVTEETSAVKVGSGSLRVLATPVLCAWFEQAAACLAQKKLPEGQTTVGCAISVEHLAPTPLGMQVQITAELEEQKGRSFSFRLTAKDASGVCARGTHTRVSVDSARFQQKADAKQMTTQK